MSGVLIAWGDPPVSLPRSYNPNDPLQETSENEMVMELKYLLPFLKFLGTFSVFKRFFHKHTRQMLLGWGLLSSFICFSFEFVVTFFNSKYFEDRISKLGFNKTVILLF